MLDIVPSNRFKKDLKLAIRRGYNSESAISHRTGFWYIKLENVSSSCSCQGPEPTAICSE